MRHLLQPSTLMALYSVLAGVVFAALAIFVPTYILLPIMNSICLGVVGAVTIVFSPLLVRAFKLGSFDRVSQLICGMALMWFSLLGSRLASLYVNITGRASEVASSPVIAFLAYMAIIGGVMHISAPGTINAEWKYNKGTLKWGVASGVVIAIAAVYAQWAFKH